MSARFPAALSLEYAIEFLEFCPFIRWKLYLKVVLICMFHMNDFKLLFIYIFVSMYLLPVHILCPFFVFFESSQLFNPLMKNLCIIITDKVTEKSLLLLSNLQLTLCQYQHWPLLSPWHSSFCSWVPISVFLRCSSSHIGHASQVIFGFIFLCVTQVTINHAKTICLAVTKMGSESKHEDGILCGLLHFG